MSEHTPGPWYAVQVGNWWCLQTGPGYGDKSLLSSDEPIVFGGECYGDGGVTEAEAAANAQLCAAAPDLLAAVEAELVVLESQLANFDQYGIDATLARAFKVGLRKRINALRDAINKAKGE